jgi:L-threonylcarbamoyladenylate synthase
LSAANIRVADEASIAEAALRLANGEVVAFPTETVYGLGADAASLEAVAAIYRIKGRPAEHPLIVHVLDARQAAWWGEIGEAGQRLIAAFWPGPLTLIVRRRAQAPDFACGGESTVGLRSPSHPVARDLLAAVAHAGGHGVAAPSANRFGRVSPTRAAHVADDLGEDVGLILDGGACEVGVESTIVDLSRGDPVLLRPGGIDAQRIAEVLGEQPGAPDAEAPRAPGTLAAHYAPRTPLELVDGDLVADRAARLAREGLRIGVWSRRPPPAIEPIEPDTTNPAKTSHRGLPSTAPAQRSRLPGHWHWESQPSDPERFARELYDTLRRLDAMGLQRLLVERVPQASRWDAVGDRLARAAATFEERR